jgi:hypothetical protein
LTVIEKLAGFSALGMFRGRFDGIKEKSQQFAGLKIESFDLHQSLSGFLLIARTPANSRTPFA